MSPCARGPWYACGRSSITSSVDSSSAIRSARAIAAASFVASRAKLRSGLDALRV